MFKVKYFLPLCANCIKRAHIHNKINVNKAFSSQSNKNSEPNDAPIKYSTSPASKYKAKSTRTGIEEERLWYEPYVIIGSISIFMLYFCVFREENDVDKELGTSLYSRIEGLEEYQLKLSLEYNRDRGIELDIRKRLEEIEQEKLNRNVPELE